MNEIAKSGADGANEKAREAAPELSRKQFLQRAGLAGAGAMLGGALSPNTAHAAPENAPASTRSEERLAQAPNAPAPDNPQSSGRWNVRDFGARGDGQSDDTKAFQEALTAAGKSGLGGTVEVPLGNYLLRGSISVPIYVTLEGIWNAPMAWSQNKGTTLLATGGRGEENGTPFITLQANAVLKGITIFYPEQKPEAIVAYPWCVFGAGGDNMTILDCLLVNPYQAIDFATNASGRHFIRNVQGQPLKCGLFVDKCLDIGRVENVHFWPFWNWEESTGIREWMWKNGTSFQFARNDWGYVFNTFAFGYDIGYRFVRSTGGPQNGALTGPMNGSLIGIAADACNVPLQIDATSNPGLLISNGQFVSIDIRLYAGKSGAWRDDPQAQKNPPRGLNTPDDFDGIVQLQNCTFFGGMENTAQISGGAVSFSNCSFKDWDRGRTNAPSIDVRGGVVTVNGCLFNQAAKQLRLRDDVQGAVFIGNRTLGELQIENTAKADLQIGFNLSPKPRTSTRLNRRFYSGFEAGQPQALANVSSDGKSAAASEMSAPPAAGAPAGAAPAAVVMEGVSSAVRARAGRGGGAAFVLSGWRVQTGHVYTYRRAFTVNVPVQNNTVLRYWMRPSDAASTQSGLDLLLSDNTFLRGVPATSESGVGLHPTVAKGTVGNWTLYESRIGRWLAGKTITAILVAHDSDAGPGPFEITFDDIEIGEPLERQG